MSQLSIVGVSIRRDEQGRYCLSDLHRASGGEKRNRPGYWLSNQRALELIREIGCAGIPVCPVSTVNDGKNNGTYISKELVYAYAMWISPAFHLKVICAYDAMIAQQPQFQVPATLLEALLLAGQLAAEKEVAIAKIEADKPKVEFAKRVRNMEGACSVGDFAKSLGMGRNRFFRRLREDGILMKNNIPYQPYVVGKRFVVIEQIPFTDSRGKSHPAFTTHITGKGQVWLEKKYRAAQTG